MGRRIATKDPRGGWRAGKDMKTKHSGGSSTARFLRRLRKKEGRALADRLGAEYVEQHESHAAAVRSRMEGHHHA